MIQTRSVMTLLAVFAAFLTATTVSANSIEEKNIERGRTTLDPENGYVFLSAPGRFAGTFIRVPNDEDIADYQLARSDALAAASEDYVRDHQRWERRAERARQRQREVPEEPIEPTEESYVFTAIENFTSVSFGPDFVFSKDEDDGSYAYLTEMKPGRYIWYGPVIFDYNLGYIGFCYCMGTIEFDVTEGTVTDLGNYLFAGPRFQDQPTAPIPNIQHSGGFNGYRITVPGDDAVELAFGVPESLSAFPSVIPEFHATGKMNNHHGVTISRLAPIDGVLSYQRDTVIDERTGESFVSEALE